MNQPSHNYGAASESTKIEQARAVAEVQGAIVAAKSHPRDPVKAQGLMMSACSHRALADVAFYSFPRGGKKVTGPTIHLARELARCWGNISYNIVELNRSDTGGFSEMMAIATDLETNVTARMQFIQPHARDKNEGGGALVSLRDIYENNTNNGARRLRECIYNILPVGFISDAEDACRAALTAGDGRPFPEQVESTVKAFVSIGVTVDQLAIKFDGRGPDRFIPEDLARLRVIWKSMGRGETSVADEFQKPTITAKPVDGFVTASLGQKAKEDIDATTGTPLPGQEQGRGTSEDGDLKPIGAIIGQTAQVKAVDDGFPADKPNEVPDMAEADLEAVYAKLHTAHDVGLTTLRKTFYEQLPMETYSPADQGRLQVRLQALLKTAKMESNNAG